MCEETEVQRASERFNQGHLTRRGGAGIGAQVSANSEVGGGCSGKEGWGVGKGSGENQEGREIRTDRQKGGSPEC